MSLIIPRMPCFMHQMLGSVCSSQSLDTWGTFTTQFCNRMSVSNCAEWQGHGYIVPRGHILISEDLHNFQIATSFCKIGCVSKTVSTDDYQWPTNSWVVNWKSCHAPAVTTTWYVALGGCGCGCGCGCCSGWIWDSPPPPESSVLKTSAECLPTSEYW